MARSRKQSKTKIEVTVSNLRRIPKWSVIDVAWLDITEDSVGNPEEAECVTRKTLGRFYAVKRAGGINCLVMSNTRDPDGPRQSGWICIPTAVIKEAELIQEGNDG